MAERAARTTGRGGWRVRPLARLVPLDSGRAERGLLDMADAAGHLPRLVELLAGRGRARDFLAAVFDLSPFLRDAARRRPEMLDRLFDAGVEERLHSLLAEIASVAGAESE